MDGPVLFSPATGWNVLPMSRDVTWGEPPNLIGYKISSEVISSNALESEVANDFMIGTATFIDMVIGYGGYYQWTSGDPEGSAYNLRFYEDGGCVPGVLAASLMEKIALLEFIGYDGFGFPDYRLSIHVAFPINGNVIYWLSIQAAGHQFPPQWGRLETGGMTHCNSMVRCAALGLPDWTPVEDLIGRGYDAALELTTRPDATQRTTWGLIKALSR